MSKSLDEFKMFVKDKPYLKDKVRSNKTSWQELYEHYDLYGSEDEIFSPEEETKVEDEQTVEESEKSEEDSTASILGLLSGLDLDKISNGLNSMKKVLNILSEVTKKDDNGVKPRPKPYQKEDD